MRQATVQRKNPQTHTHTHIASSLLAKLAKLQHKLNSKFVITRHTLVATRLFVRLYLSG